MSKRHFVFFLGFVIGALATLTEGPAFGASLNPPETSLLGYMPVFSDFDGDNLIDQAVLSSNGPQKQIRVTFGKFTFQLLGFDAAAAEQGRLVSGDFDSDGDIDLIWFSQSYPQKSVMWAGDGRGSFSVLHPSEAFSRRIQELLRNDSMPRLAGNSDGRDLACILLTAFYAGPTHAPPLLPILSSVRLVGSNQIVALNAFWLSSHHKRGPPSRLS